MCHFWRQIIKEGLLSIWLSEMLVAYSQQWRSPPKVRSWLRHWPVRVISLIYAFYIFHTTLMCSIKYFLEINFLKFYFFCLIVSNYSDTIALYVIYLIYTNYNYKIVNLRILYAINAGLKSDIAAISHGFAH